MQSVPFTNKVVSSNPARGEVYSIQHYVKKLLVTCGWSMDFSGQHKHWQYNSRVNEFLGSFFFLCSVYLLFIVCGSLPCFKAFCLKKYMYVLFWNFLFCFAFQMKNVIIYFRKLPCTPPCFFMTLKINYTFPYYI